MVDNSITKRHFIYLSPSLARYLGLCAGRCMYLVQGSVVLVEVLVVVVVVVVVVYTILSWTGPDGAGEAGTTQ